MDTNYVIFRVAIETILQDLEAKLDYAVLKMDEHGYNFFGPEEHARLDEQYRVRELLRVALSSFE